ncbi:hypothetical protein RGT18_19230 [Solobacterium moorei]|nr:hypothetical protein RGT18_19230 [Solobacterium moorei]
MKLKAKYKRKLETLEEIALILIFMLIYARVFLFLVGIDL